MSGGPPFQISCAPPAINVASLTAAVTKTSLAMHDVPRRRTAQRGFDGYRTDVSRILPSVAHHFGNRLGYACFVDHSSVQRGDRCGNLSVRQVVRRDTIGRRTVRRGTAVFRAWHPPFSLSVSRFLVFFCHVRRPGRDNNIGRPRDCRSKEEVSPEPGSGLKRGRFGDGGNQADRRTARRKEG